MHHRFSREELYNVVWTEREMGALVGSIQVGFRLDTSRSRTNPSQTMVWSSREMRSKRQLLRRSRSSRTTASREETCIVVRTNEEAVEYADWLESIGKKTLRLERDVSDDQSTPGVRVATMHRVKGLEFDAVIVAGYRGPEHWAKVFAEEADAGAYVDVLASERCLLHVAATRAKKYLMVRKLTG